MCNRCFRFAMDKINSDSAKGDQKGLASDLKAASDQMWKLAAPTYSLVQRLEEAHNEWAQTKLRRTGTIRRCLRLTACLSA